MPPRKFFAGIISPMFQSREPLPVPPLSPSDSDTLRVSESTASDSTCLELSNDSTIQNNENNHQKHYKREKKVMFHAITLVIDPGPGIDVSQQYTSEESEFLRKAFSSHHQETEDVVEDLGSASPPENEEIHTVETSVASIRVLKFLVTSGASTHTFECPVLLLKSTSDLFSPLVSISESRPVASLVRVGSQTLPSSTIEQKSSNVGVFADQDISQGECILSERPCLVTIYSILDGNHGEDLRKLFDSLSPETINEAISLLSPDDSEDSVWYEEILRRHSLAIRLSRSKSEVSEEDSKHRGLFLKSSRISHSCTPNARWGWHMKTFSLRVYAIQPISEGMEITVAKIKLDLIHAAGSPTGFRCISKSCVGSCADSQSHSRTTQLDKPSQNTDREEHPSHYPC